MAKLFASSGDPDQMLHSASSDLGLLCLPVTLLRIFRQKWVYYLWAEVPDQDHINRSSLIRSALFLVLQTLHHENMPI